MNGVNIFGNCRRCREKVVRRYRYDRQRYFIKAIPIMSLDGNVRYLCSQCKAEIIVDKKVLKNIRKLSNAINTTRIHNNPKSRKI